MSLFEEKYTRKQAEDYAVSALFNTFMGLNFELGGIAYDVEMLSNLALRLKDNMYALMEDYTKEYVKDKAHKIIYKEIEMGKRKQ